MPDLISYIKSLQERGYDIPTIKNYLLKYGYPEQALDQAIYNLERRSKFNLMPVLAVLVILLLGGAAAFFIFSPAKVPAKLLDVSVECDPEIAPNQMLTATATFKNMGSTNRYDVYVKYEIVGDNAQIAVKSETLALDSEQNHTIKLKIPKDLNEGQYTLQVTVKYNQDQAKAYASFIVRKEGSPVTPIINASCTDGKQNQGETGIDCGGPCKPCKKCQLSCDDNNSLTIDSCDELTGECKHAQVASCGDGVCSSTEDPNTCPDDCITPSTKVDETIWEKLDNIKNLSKTDPQQAINECNTVDPDYKNQCLQNIAEVNVDPNICEKMTDDMQKDRCYSNAAQALKQSVLCENIQKESRRDNCYILLAVDGDYSICEKIVNSYVKKSCESYKQAQQ